ncbi:hypothetical protein DFJ74DRAFT_296600 [Hyaloraphidium curvatum]|nr:hypothetical protein DFJ74DRAFT_296600 [Hyaloraphidium curvatum]
MVPGLVPGLGSNAGSDMQELPCTAWVPFSFNANHGARLPVLSRHRRPNPLVVGGRHQGPSSDRLPYKQGPRARGPRAARKPRHQLPPLHTCIPREMGLGDRRDGPLGGGPGGQVGDRRFKMRQNMVSIGDDFWIENGVGRKAYKIDGKAITLRNTLVMETPQGAALLQMQGKAVSVRQAMDIERPGGKGEPFCTIKKDLVNVVRDEYEVKMRGGKPDLEVRGNILGGRPR